MLEQSKKKRKKLGRALEKGEVLGVIPLKKFKKNNERLKVTLNKILISGQTLARAFTG
jgi:hypothetical protein